MVNRAIAVFIFFLGSVAGMAQQHPVLFGGVEYYRDVGFEENAYANLHVGSQVYQWKFFAPEIGFDTYFGSLQERNFNTVGEPNSIPEAKFKTQFSSYFFSFSPKLKFGNQEAALVIIPQYNIGKAKARGDYLVYNGNLYAKQERNSSSENQSFWSIAAGVEGQIFEVENLWFSLYLKYTRLNSEEVVSSLDFSEYNFQPNGGSADGLGLGFRVYYDLFSALW